MNKKMQGKINKKKVVNTAKECAYIAIFVALVIAAQMVLAVIPGVEFVTVLFVSYAFVFGWKRGVTAATVFALLRQFIFGFYPQVLVLYLLHFNALTLLFGLLGSKVKKPARALPLIVVVACVSTACFTMTDNILTSLWYGYSQRAMQVYFMASLPVMATQVLCSAVSVALLFLPLQMAFSYIKKTLR